MRIPWALTQSPSVHLGDKKRKKSIFFSFFYKYFIGTCTQNRGDNTEEKNSIKGCSGHAEYYLPLVLISGRGVDPPPLIRDMSPKNMCSIFFTPSLFRSILYTSPREAAKKSSSLNGLFGTFFKCCCHLKIKVILL